MVRKSDADFMFSYCSVLIRNIDYDAFWSSRAFSCFGLLLIISGSEFHSLYFQLSQTPI